MILSAGAKNLTLYMGSIVGLIVSLVYFAGLISAIMAILYSRTPQGAIAWSVALILLPFVSLPLFVVFGRNRFHGMINLRRSNDQHLVDIYSEMKNHHREYALELGAWFGNARVLKELTKMSFIRGNETRLLIDGEATFKAMFAAIDDAEHYVVAEFYIVNDDELGRQFQQNLIKAANRGCRVYLLFDEVGSRKISQDFIQELTDAGIQVSGVKTTRGWINRFQLNFRNHRKILIADGKTALVGGHNIGDEYLHRCKRLTPWRDTHMQLEGPAVLGIQLAFTEDWLWATGEVPNLEWTPPQPKESDQTVFVLPSGPDDEYETCGLFFTHLINCAQHRLWIASPYFVPDEGIVTALQLAAMRGVDVRILIPGKPDKWLVKAAAMSYVDEVTGAGVKMYEYGQGFLHQKVAIVDNEVSLIGTANFDNRSFRLNFEITIMTLGQPFNQEVCSMLEHDFANSTLIDPAVIDEQGFAFKASSRVARLFAPIL